MELRLRYSQLYRSRNFTLESRLRYKLLFSKAILSHSPLKNHSKILNETNDLILYFANRFDVLLVI